MWVVGLLTDGIGGRHVGGWMDGWVGGTELGGGRFLHASMAYVIWWFLLGCFLSTGPVLTYLDRCERGCFSYVEFEVS